jgi:hypothetical protein
MKTPGFLLASGWLLAAGCGHHGASPQTSAILSWDAPTTYSDGSALTVAGYRVYSGDAPGAYAMPVDVQNATTYTFPDLASGTYYFAVTVYDPSGTECLFSNEVSKTIP